MRIAPLHSRFLQLITDHYIIGKYRLHTREISIFLSDGATISYKDDDNMFNVFVYNDEEMLLVLRHFGHILTNLKIKVSEDGYKNIEEIQSGINNYCANAIQEIILYRSEKHKGAMDKNISFEHVKKVTVHNVGLVKSIRLDKAFPLMEILIIDRQRDLNQYYPHLTTVKFPLLYGYSDVTDLSDFVRLNPQLRNLDTPIYNSVTYLTSLSNVLPNLSSLSLGALLSEEYTFDAFPIARFKRVKMFSLNVNLYANARLWTSALREILASIRFDQLESFSLHPTRPESLNFLIGLIVRNTALHSVIVESELTFDQLSALLTPLQQLEELTVDWQKASTLGVLSRFLEHVIESNHNLEKFTVRLSQYDRLTFADLVEYIPVGWGYNEGSVKENKKLVHIERRRLVHIDCSSLNL